MRADRKHIGCVAMIIGAIMIGGATMNDSSPRNKTPVQTQLETGPVRHDPTVARDSAYTRNPAPAPPPTPVFVQPVYTPPLTRAQILDSNPVQSEPLPGLQGQANTFGSDAALKLINHLPSPAYVKVVNGSGATVATVYLRTQESYQLEIPAGSYQVKYAKIGRAHV